MNPPRVCEVQMIHRLHEPRATGERGFVNRSFSYIAPRLYNKLPITIKQIDSLIPLKVILRQFFFPVPMISQVLLFRRIMHCKFGGRYGGRRCSGASNGEKTMRERLQERR